MVTSKHLVFLCVVFAKLDGSLGVLICILGSYVIARALIAAQEASEDKPWVGAGDLEELCHGFQEGALRRCWWGTPTPSL